MASRKPKENDAGLPFSALQLLAPPVRLVSAALWKVMKRRDVMQYGVLEEFVTSACETVPGLLTFRHQSKLALGLRSRLILELCRTQPDAKVIEPHLKRIRAPAAPSHSSATTVRKDVKVKEAVEHFHTLVNMLLTDPTADVDQYFKGVFLEDYGPTFDQELEKLLWEFLIRLDQFLPVPNLSQTVSWLSDAPAVLEECAQAATQPQLLRILLQHQTCLGHLETAASLPPNMGDSILASLSLPPSGRVPSTSSRKADATQTRDKTPFITPVIGLISNEDVPFMTSASKRSPRGSEPASSKEAVNMHFYSKVNSKFTLVRERHKSNGDSGKEEGRSTWKQSNGVKRKQPDGRENASEEEEEVSGGTESGKKRLRQGGGAPKAIKSEETGKHAEVNRGVLATSLRLTADPSLDPLVISCLNSQPKVIVNKMSVTSGSITVAGSGGKASQKLHQRRKSPAMTPARKSSQLQKLDSDFPALNDKENHPFLPSLSSAPSPRRSHTEPLPPPADGEDYVADSEDEATKNFKVRLFMKRYYKTKHGTYVPTLREFRKPGTPWREMLLSHSKRR